MASSNPSAHDPCPLICHIIYQLDYGGLENGLVNLINAMPPQRYRHAILCLTHATRFRDRLHRSDVSILEAHKRDGKDPGCYLRVGRMIRRLRPDIVHTRNLTAVDMVVPARLAGVTRIVHSEHGLDAIELDGANRKYNLLRRLVRPLISRQIAVSADLERWLSSVIGVADARLSRVYNGVNTVRFKPGARTRARLPAGFTPVDGIVIGAVGRLEPIKDQVTLARAFVKLLERAPALREQLRLVIIGEGRLRGPVEAVLRTAHALELAWLPGFRDDMPDLYHDIDLFALPSRREGISNTLLEAMACGLPVVATGVGGTPEIVPDGQVGRLVPAADADGLAEAIHAYVADPELRARHGTAARKWVEERFSMEAMVRGYLAVYDAL